jgi:choline dehydrogenase-like flavoprotein
MTRIETEIAIVGSGPAGATLARELCRQGRKVVLLEKGRWHQWPVGRFASMGTITRTVRSRQGGLMARGITAGGSSVVFNGNAYDPPSWLGSELGIDLCPETAATKAELGIKPLPESFYQSWPATRRLVESAGELDIPLHPQAKFIDPEKCDPRCDDCMFGCRQGAKWTARSFLEEAREHGARVLLNAEVDRVILEAGQAKGVKLAGPGGLQEVRGEKVILSAGGLGTPLILMRSGIERAGEGFFIDPMNVVLAVGKEHGTFHEMTFAFASEEFVESDGYLVGTVGALMVLGAQLAQRRSFRAWRRVLDLRRIMGMFTKIGDSPGGRIDPDGTIDKPYPAQDREKFRKGTEACQRILIKAGADPDSILVAHDIGGHPGGTAAIGRVVDRDLQALAAKNLYVCDASVFPRTPGRPPTLTLIALAKYLAKRI